MIAFLNTARSQKLYVICMQICFSAKSVSDGCLNANIVAFGCKFRYHDIGRMLCRVFFVFKHKNLNACGLYLWYFHFLYIFFFMFCCGLAWQTGV